ncbi:unnamed protein product [Sphagnum jensenii]|uniref:CCHC-type domain-containing protein n=1 Tax=Sphagnum jensenii TaxID=128206 RepID=A0ABP1AKX7_9BRYO
MATPTNFYKNSAYAYAREFDLSSVLDNLHAYRLATGAAAAPEVAGRDKEPGSFEAAQKVETTKRSTSRHQHDSRRRREGKHYHPYCQLTTAARNSVDCITQLETHGQSSREVAMPELESMGHWNQSKVSQGRATSVMGFDPYNMKSDEEVPLKVGRVELQKPDTIGSSIFGFDPQQESSSDEDSKISTHTKHADDLCPLPVESSTEEVVVKRRSDQRFAAPGEPTCAICGRFGAYICDETEDDVCSLECKHELLQQQAEAHAQAAAEAGTSFVAPVTPVGALQLPETEIDKWDYKKHRWTYRHSSLSTFRCWKCKRPGHLPDDCVVTMAIPAPSPANPTLYQIPVEQKRREVCPRAELRALYKRCKQIGAVANSSTCGKCGTRFNLAFCLDCSKSFCDSLGHLTQHLQENPSHRQLYSFKMQRAVKCCNGLCPVVDMRKLFACNSCMTKAFDKYYSMYNATWEGGGLKMIINAVCCDDHFDWHRMNCPHADVEESGFLLSKDGSDLYRSQLSEFLF